MKKVKLSKSERRLINWLLEDIAVGFKHTLSEPSYHKKVVFKDVERTFPMNSKDIARIKSIREKL